MATLLAEGETTHIVTGLRDEGRAAAGEIFEGISRSRIGKRKRDCILNALHINGNDLTLEAVREVAARTTPGAACLPTRARR